MADVPLNGDSQPGAPPQDSESTPQAPSLRKRAEQRLRSSTTQGMTATEVENLVHELQVHQIELEMQNEELISVQVEKEEAWRRYLELYDHAPIGYVTMSADGQIQQANLAAAEILGRSRNHLHVAKLREFILPRDQDVIYRWHQRLLRSARQATCEVRLRRADHQIRWVQMDATPGRTGSGDDELPSEWRVTLADITARKSADETLRQAHTRLRLAAEVIDLAFWEWDPRTDAVSFPPEWRQQTGYCEWEATPKRLFDWVDLLHPDDRGRVLAWLKRFAGTHCPHPNQEIEYRMRCKHRGYRWLAARLALTAEDHAAPGPVVLVQQDIHARKGSADQALQRAQHDALTGLPTRALIEAMAVPMLHRAERQGNQVAILFFDLDRFKPINDLHGHALGDRLLQAFAQRLRGAFRAEDVVGRLGGDEFLVVLPDLHDSEAAERAVSNALAALAAVYLIEHLELDCPASVGISLFPQDGATFSQLVKQADRAMFQAKQVSPGRYQFVTETLNRQTQRAHTLGQTLRKALEDGALRLAYQPVVDIRSGAVVRVEALLRWPQPDGNEIAPDELVPIAERTGLIHEIGRWVLDEACRQHMAWRHSGLPVIPVTMNVSAQQFRHEGFIDNVRAALDASGMAPDALTLEISEATLMHHVPATRATLDKLAELRVRVALDDFGLSRSGLGSLSELPLDRLEINRALVRRLSVTGDLPTIVDMAVCLGNALEIDVTAVGIETEAEAAFFRERDCWQLQGFHLGVPMSGDQLAEWYRRRLTAGPPQ